MIRSRLGLKALGLCSLMLGLMAIGASGAQAEGNWNVEGAKVGVNLGEVKLFPEVKIAELLSAKVTLSTKIAGATVKFNTSNAPELIGVKLEAEGNLTTGGKAKFTGVTTELNNAASAVCTPLGSAGVDSTLGTITSNNGKGQIYLHTGGARVTKVLPETGNAFGRLFFGEFCSLPEEVPVITDAPGESIGNGLVLTDGSLNGALVETEKPAHNIKEFAGLTTLYAISETVEHKATVEGEAKVELAGAHAGLKWSGKP